MGGSLSHRFRVSNGVKQGGILSPFLFNCYLDDLSSRLNEVNVGCLIGGRKVNHLFYADDIALIAPSTKGLQSLLDTCADYAIPYLLNFNPIKSQVMIFRTKNYTTITFPRFHLNGVPLDEVNQFKYLGHFISSDLADDHDIIRATKSVYATCMSLVRRFNMCDKPVKIRLFNTYCSQVYTSHLWNTYKETTLNKASVAYNKVFRMLMKVPRYTDQGNYSASRLFASCGVRNLSNVIRKEVHGFRNRVLNSDNGLLQAVCFNFNSSRLFHFWGRALRPP